MKKNIPKYLSAILADNPKINSGRKNYEFLHLRILKQIIIIEKYFNKKIK